LITANNNVDIELLFATHIPVLVTCCFIFIVIISVVFE